MVIDIGHTGIDRLTQVVWSHIRSHTDSDPCGSIDQEVGETGRQDGRLEACIVEVGLEVHRVLLDISEHLCGELTQTSLRITHSSW